VKNLMEVGVALRSHAQIPVGDTLRCSRVRRVCLHVAFGLGEAREGRPVANDRKRQTSKRKKARRAAARLGAKRVGTGVECSAGARL
jgi:hypothetical protein